MKRVLLLNPPGDDLYIRDLYCSNTSKANYYWVPIDILVLSGMLSDAYEIKVIDAIVERRKPASVIAEIAQFRPDAVISLTGSASWEGDAAFFQAIKREVGATIVITGDLSLDKSDEILRQHDFVDASLLDFTSVGVRTYLDAPAGSMEKIDNVVFKRNGAIVRGAQVSDFGKTFTIPVPRHDLFPLAKYRLPYLKAFPMTTVLGSFACPFPCTFCIQSSHVQKFKYRPAENVMEELRVIRGLGVKEFHFRDPLFEANPKNARKLCQMMIDENLGLHWSCNSRVDTLDEELIALMKRSGCHYVIFGLESGDEAILRRSSKKITLEQMRVTIARCRRHGIRTAGYFIIGLPGETRETALTTIKFARELGIDYASFSIPSPDYGTPLRKEAIEKGWIQEDLRSFNRSKRIVVKHENLSEQEMSALLRRAVREFYFRPEFVKTRLKEINSPRAAWNTVCDASRVFMNYVWKA
jgi:anaerobic magnesium-protoporphyrin IX monomethyl ester cyclase